MTGKTLRRRGSPCVAPLQKRFLNGWSAVAASWANPVLELPTSSISEVGKQAQQLWPGQESCHSQGGYIFSDRNG